MQTTLGPQPGRATAVSSARFPSLANAVLSLLSVAVCFTDSGPLQWLGGAALALALPGDAVRRAIGVARTGTAAATFTLATSLSVTVFVGLAVDQLSAGITARTMAVGLLAVTVVGDIVALARSRAGADQPGDIQPVGIQPLDDDTDAAGGLTWKHFVLCAALFAIPAAVGLTLSVRASNRHDESQASTALSIVQQGTTAVVEVLEAAPGPHTYVLEVTTGDRELLEQTVTLGKGMQASIPVDVSALTIGTPIDAGLTQTGATSPFRTVSLVRGRA